MALFVLGKLIVEQRIVDQRKAPKVFLVILLAGLTHAQAQDPRAAVAQRPATQRPSAFGRFVDQLLKSCGRLLNGTDPGAATSPAIKNTAENTIKAAAAATAPSNPYRVPGEVNLQLVVFEENPLDFKPIRQSVDLRTGGTEGGFQGTWRGSPIAGWTDIGGVKDPDRWWGSEDSIGAAQNEDGTTLLVVADGVGSAGRGAQAASRGVIEAFLSALLTAEGPKGNPAQRTQPAAEGVFGLAMEKAYDRLQSAFEASHRAGPRPRVDEAQQRIFGSDVDPRHPTIESYDPNLASTVVAAHIQNDRLVMGHLGDSPAFVFRPRHSKDLPLELLHRTRPHTMFEDLKATGLISEERLQEMAHLTHITQFVGLNDGKPEPFTPERSREIQLEPGDIVVLASDGLLALTEQEIEAIVWTTRFRRTESDPQTLAVRLTQGLRQAVEKKILLSVNARPKPHRDHTSILVYVHRGANESSQMRTDPNQMR
jgi:serine/threonine protein phosphatase PrpC